MNSLEKTNVVDIYNEIANSFSSTRSSPWPLVKKHLDSINSDNYPYIADIGCGNGVNQFNNNFIFESLDISQSMCSLGPMNPIIASAIEIPYRSNTFDHVISIACIHHLSTQLRRKQAVSEIFRILKPGGTAFISVWSEQTRYGSGDQLIKWKTENTLRYYHLFSPKELYETFRGYNFTCQEDHNNYFITFTK